MREPPLAPHRGGSAWGGSHVVGHEVAIVVMSNMVPIGQIWGAGKEAPLSQHNLIGEGMELAPPGSPYIAPHVLSRSQKLCIAKDHTCKGFRSAGTNYCAGHQRSLGLLKPKVKEEPVDGDAAGTS